MDRIEIFVGYPNAEIEKDFLDQNMKNLCGSCKFFVPFDKPSWVDSYSQALHRHMNLPLINSLEFNGQCRRYPPVFAEVDDMKWMFAETDWDGWCGEYVDENLLPLF
jgi:hypothetical protein